MRIEATWFLVIGSLLIGVGLARGFIARLPVTGALIYLIAALFSDQPEWALLNLDLHRDAHVLRISPRRDWLSRCLQSDCYYVSRSPTGSGCYRCAWRGLQC